MAFYGTHTLNTNLTLNNNHIKFGENSKIVVPYGRTLTIDNFSLLETCGNYLWKGIEVQPGGNIVVKHGSTIKDALTAVTLNGICNALFENSFFQNNVKHIAKNSAPSGTHPAKIYGNIFSCSTLKGSFNGTITQAAIELQNVNFVKIGNTLGPGFQNVYSGASVGIKAISSGFEMYNNKFMNIGCVSNYPAGTACSFGGLNSNYPSVIENHATTDDASSWYYPEGIRVENSQKAFIKDNTVTELLPNKMGYGIRVESTPSAGVYCNNITDARIAMFYGGFNYTSTVAANYMTTCKNGFYVNWGQIGLQGPGKWSYLNAWIGPIADRNSHFLVYGTNNSAFDGNLSRLNLKVPGSIYYPGGVSGYKSSALGPSINPSFNAAKMNPMETSSSLTNPNEVPSFVSQCRDLNGDLELFSSKISEYIAEGDTSYNESDSLGFGSAAAQEAHAFLIRSLYEDSTGIFLAEIGDTLANSLFQSALGGYLEAIDQYQNGVNTTITASTASAIQPQTKSDSLMADALRILFIWKESENDSVAEDTSLVNYTHTLAQLCPYEYGEGVYVFRGIYAYFFPDTAIANPCEQSDYEMLERKGKQNKVAPEETNDLIIYPNPTDGTINIVDLKGIGGTFKEVEVFDIAGKKLKEIKCTNSIINFVQIDLNDLASGTYIIKISRTASAPDSYKIQKK